MTNEFILMATRHYIGEINGSIFLLTAAVIGCMLLLCLLIDSNPDYKKRAALAWFIFFSSIWMWIYWYFICK